MSVTALTDDSQAITLLCSALALPHGAGTKPLSPTEWSSLAATVYRSDVQRPGALLGLDADSVERRLEVSTEAARRLTALLARGGQLALELDRLAGRGIWIVTRADENYPSLLKERLKNTAPPLLFGAGPPGLLLERSLAVVGSREADESSLAFSTLLGRRSAEAGFAVVSGAARGVDAAAMVAAADAGGSAVGVVAEALEKMMRRRDLREHLVEGNVTLVSAYHPSAPFTVGNAMRRNRLIYCLAEAAIVVAASAENGGTRGGALENLKAGWTPLFVRSDDDAPPGNRDLLRLGGLPLRRDDLDGDDFIQLLLAPREGHRQVVLDELGTPVRESEGGPELPAAAAIAGRDKPARELPRRERRAIASNVAPDDLFPAVWPRLAPFLREPRSEKEVATAFALEQGQARAWLKRGVAEGLVERLERPARYCLASAGPAELFPPEDAGATGKGDTSSVRP